MIRLRPSRVRSSTSAVKVMVVSHEASRSGAPRVAQHLLKALEEVGFDTIVVHRWGGPLKDDLDNAAVHARVEPLAVLRVMLRRWTLSKRLALNLERFAIRWIVRSERPDIVWCNTVLTAVYAHAALASGARCIVYSHEASDLVASALLRAGLIERGTGGAPTTLGRRVEYVGCSTAASANVERVLRAVPGSVRVLHSPVDVALTRKSAAGGSPANPDSAVVLAVGLGTQGKGVDVFAAAAERYKDAPQVSWRWIGAVPSHLRVPWVDFPGELANVAGEIAGAAVFVLPSRADQFPLVVLEAMALGRPIVATRLPGTLEQLGSTAVFVDAGEPEDLADAVEHLLGDPFESSELGAAAAQRCERLWSVEHFAREVQAITEATL